MQGCAKNGFGGKICGGVLTEPHLRQSAPPATVDHLLPLDKGFLGPDTTAARHQGSRAAPAPAPGQPSSTRPAIQRCSLDTGHRTPRSPVQVLPPKTQHQSSAAARPEGPEAQNGCRGFRQSKPANAGKAASRAALKDATRHPLKRHPRQPLDTAARQHRTTITRQHQHPQKPKLRAPE